MKERIGYLLMSDQARQKATVFIGGLDNNVNEQTLHDAFIPFGEIVDISMPKPELYVCLKKYRPIYSVWESKYLEDMLTL